MTSTSAVRVTNVSKTFGVTRALSDVSLNVTAGSSVALLGKNGAGKSTLVSIITGLQTPDSGDITFGNGGRGHAESIGCVYQKSTLINGLTAAENICLYDYPRTRLRTVDWKQLRSKGAERLHEWGCEHLSERLVEDLDPVERKIVEISRILSIDPHVLLLDEPTAGLDLSGSRKLFEHIRSARERGVAIIYVSHYLEEVFDVCDRAAVLRDGRLVLDQHLSGLSVGDLVEAMVGDTQKAQDAEQPPRLPDSDPQITVESLTIPARCNNITFQARAGECLGITGLDGSGHVQIAEALCGLIRPAAGTVTLAGKAMDLGNVKKSIAAGVGFVPEDRHIGGYVPSMSVSENATLPVMKQIANAFRVILKKKRDQTYENLAAEWSIKAWGPGQPTEELSGGNQQKVVLARAVSSDPSVLVLMNPTAGVDVSAKRSIYTTIKQMAAQGKTVIIVSSDDSDLSICHRVLVLFHGNVHQELHSPITEHELASAIQGN